MNTDQLLLIRVRHDGDQPQSWAGGDEDFQKAKVIAAFAWSAIKHPDDPQLPNCDPSFQENCTAVVESLMLGNKPDELPFALKAAEILQQIGEKDASNQNPN